MSDYRIELGIGLNTQDFNNIKNDIRSLEKDSIEIKLNTAQAEKQIEGLKQEFRNLGDSKNKDFNLDFNTGNAKKSLAEVAQAIIDIKNALGTIDPKKGIGSLVGSVNQIAVALDKATDESNGLLTSLQALSKKDFSVNLNLKAGNANPVKAMGDYGDKVRDSVIPQLEERAQYLRKLLGGFDKAQSELTRLMTSKFGQTGAERATKLQDALVDDSSLNKQMNAYKKYLSYMQEIVSKKNGFALNDYNFKYPVSPEELIADAKKIQSGTKDVEESFEKLKQVVGGGIGAEQLSAQIKPIIDDLHLIQQAITDLSKDTSLGGLTSSFNRLSESIENLLANAEKVKGVLNSGFDDSLGTNVDDGSTERAIQDQRELAQQALETANIVVQAEERKQQAKKATSSLTKEADVAALKQTNEELKKLETTARKMGQLDFKIVKSDYNDEIELVREFERQLELLKTQYNETAKTLSSKGIDIGSITTPEFVESRNKIAEFDAQIETTKRKLAEKLQLKLDSGDFATQVSKIESDAKKLSGTYDGVEKGIKEVNAALKMMQTASTDGDIERLIDANNKYEDALKKVENQLKQNKIAEQNVAAQQKLNDDIGLFQSKIDAWLTKNSAAVKQFGVQMLDLKAKAEGCDRTTLNHLEAEFKQVDRAAEVAGKKTQTLGDSLKTQFSKYSTYFGVAELFMYVEQGLRDMFEQVKLIDSAMTELKKVTDETDASYNRFLTNAASRAQEIGTTIDGLVSSTADFARLGYGFEDAQGLAEVANIYAVVGDEVEGVEGATESLISTMAAFKDQMNGMSNADFAMSIIDVYNEIGKLIA